MPSKGSARWLSQIAVRGHVGSLPAPFRGAPWQHHPRHPPRALPRLPEPAGGGDQVERFTPSRSTTSGSGSRVATSAVRR